MHKEIGYTQSVGAQHIKAFGQYFTNAAVADFMCSWACQAAHSMLDPAVGNSIFFTCARKFNPHCSMTGYELDPQILHHFGNPTGAQIINEDYLLNGWDHKYDAIVCNPPYNRFQAVENRNEILDTIFQHTGVRYSGYTNLYILFLIKSIHQLAETGKLAYIIPSEFMNSKYGTAIKQLLLDRKLLRSVINFEHNEELFFNATTTCCILLLDQEPKTHVAFYNLKSVSDLTHDLLQRRDIPCVSVDYSRLTAEEKWRVYLNQEEPTQYNNLKPISHFCSVSRGIATGANDFFCFSQPKAAEHGIPMDALSKCVCRSADVKGPVFDLTDFQRLSEAGKTVYLLDITEADHERLSFYLQQGKAHGVDKKYLPSCRSPWYSMERKAPAPIWVASACRGALKFVRNLSMAKSLTTFHSVFIHPQYEADTDLIFSYFLTPTAQAIIRQNRKELGNGLEKFQPNDLNTAKMLDITLLSPKDRLKVLELYQKLKNAPSPTHVRQLDEIFSAYLQ